MSSTSTLDFWNKNKLTISFGLAILIIQLLFAFGAGVVLFVVGADYSNTSSKGVDVSNNLVHSCYGFAIVLILFSIIFIALIAVSGKKYANTIQGQKYIAVTESMEQPSFTYNIDYSDIGGGGLGVSRL